MNWLIVLAELVAMGMVPVLLVLAVSHQEKLLDKIKRGGR